MVRWWQPWLDFSVTSLYFLENFIGLKKVSHAPLQATCSYLVDHLAYCWQAFQCCTVTTTCQNTGKTKGDYCLKGRKYVFCHIYCCKEKMHLLGHIKIPVFRVTQPQLNLPLKPRIFFRFSGKKYMILQAFRFMVARVIVP